MAKETYPIPKSNPNAAMSVTFFLMWVVNIVIVWLANNMFPQSFVLGTISVTPTFALLLSTGVLAWFTTIVMPLFTEIEIRKQMVLSPHHWLIGYLIVNIVGVWGITRFADVLGLGVGSIAYVVGLAAVLDFAQGMTMMAYGQAMKKN